MSLCKSDPIREDLSWYFLSAAFEAYQIQSNLSAVQRALELGNQTNRADPEDSFSPERLSAIQRAKRIERNLCAISIRSQTILRVYFESRSTPAPIRVYFDDLAPLVYLAPTANHPTIQPIQRWDIRIKSMVPAEITVYPHPIERAQSLLVAQSKPAKRLLSQIKKEAITMRDHALTEYRDVATQTKEQTK